MSKLTKISKQHPRTWAHLHRRLISTSFNYGCVFSDVASEFVLNMATSINSNAGYLISALLTTTLFILSLSVKFTTFNGFETVPNIYTVFVGPPSTGKSQAIKIAASLPLNQVIDDKDLVSFLIEKATPSGLFKKLATDKQGFLISPEIYDVLIRLLKTDDGLGGDISLLCELFSGEGASLTLATHSERKINAGTPFSILGSTQLPPLAKLLVTMDEGQGLLDRFLIITPECFRPTPDEREQANNFIERQKTKSFTDLFSAMYDIHTVTRGYKFDAEAKELLKEMETEFVQTLNEAIRTGTVTPKSKKIDIVQRVALAIHVTDHLLTQLLSGENPSPPPEEIRKETLENAFKLTNYCEMQKNILLEFLDSVTNGVMDEERKQPTAEEIKVALCLFPGPLVTVRAFRQSASRLLRNITQEEVLTQMRMLTSWGELVYVKIPRSRPITVFVKQRPQQIDWAAETLVSEADYVAKFAAPINRSISDGVQSFLVEKGHIHRDDVVSA